MPINTTPPLSVFTYVFTHLSTVYVKHLPPSVQQLVLTKKAFSFGETFIQKQTDVMPAFTQLVTQLFLISVVIA